MVAIAEGGFGGGSPKSVHSSDLEELSNALEGENVPR